MAINQNRPRRLRRPTHLSWSRSCADQEGSVDRATTATPVFPINNNFLPQRNSQEGKNPRIFSSLSLSIPGLGAQETKREINSPFPFLLLSPHFSTEDYKWTRKNHLLRRSRQFVNQVPLNGRRIDELGGEGGGIGVMIFVPLPLSLCPAFFFPPARRGICEKGICRRVAVAQKKTN